MITTKSGLASPAASQNGATGPESGSAPEILEHLLQRAELAGASDIHLQMHHGGGSVSFRLDGVMTPVTEFSGSVAERVFGRIKFLAKLKTY